MRIAMIAAMSENRVIGKNNQLPWHIPEDLKYFKKMTLGKPVIMGRKTFESMGSKPLPQRDNIILTQNNQYQLKECESCKIVHSVEEALAATSNCEEVMIIGGENVYQAFLPKADRLYLTIVHRTVEGDTFFPEINGSEWQVMEEHPGKEFTIRVLDRRNN